MAGKKSGPRPQPPKTGSPLIGLALGGVGMVILSISVIIFFANRFRQPINPIGPPPIVPVVENPPPVPIPPRLASAEAWWDQLSNTNLPGTVLQLNKLLPQEKMLFDDLGDKADIVRLGAYQNLIAKLSELTRDEQAKELLGRFLIDCYALEPAERNVAPLREWFVQQVPRENAEFPAAYQREDLERAFWALDVSMDAMTHKEIRLERVKHLSQDLGTALGFGVDPSVSRAELKTQAEKLLVLRCYRNLVPTAAKSIEAALALRATLLAHKVSAQLSPGFRDKVDVELAYAGLPKALAIWPVYGAVLHACLKSEDRAIEIEMVQLYAQADPALAAKMNPLLADKWKVAADEKLNQLAKAKAILKELGVPDPTDRQTQLENLTRESLARAKSPVSDRNAVLLETARLSHASTLACALLQKEMGQAKFDELVADVPEFDLSEPKAPDPKTAVAKKSTHDPKPAAGDPKPAVIAKASGPRVFSDQLMPGFFSKVHSVALRRGKTYAIDMISPFDNYLRLENSRGQLLTQDDDSGGGLNARILFAAMYDDNYRIIATSYGGRRVGPYTVSVQEIGGFAGPAFFPGKRPMRPPFGPPGAFPGMPVGIPGTPVVKGKEPGKAVPAAATQVQESDLTNLTVNNAKTRIAAMKNITENLKEDFAEKDMTYRQASIIAKYLLVNILTKDELDEVLPSLNSLAKSRNLLLALADNLDANDAKLEKTEPVLARILGVPLQVSKDANWRLPYRKALLLQAVELSGSSKDTATQTADLLRDYYKVQDVLFGVPPRDLEPMTRPSQVMEAMIKQVAAKTAASDPSADDKTLLEQVPRHLLAVQFVAKNDVEHTAMLQRVWLNVLCLYLIQQSPDRAAELRLVQSDLSASDRRATDALEQLRDGEAAILRLWAIALELK